MSKPLLPGRPLLPFTKRVRDLVRAVPCGRVASYGRIAELAGDPRQARQVGWILHSSPESEGLPWHRIIGARGRISLPLESGGREQACRLRSEGVAVAADGSIDLRAFGWQPLRRKKTALDSLDLDGMR